MQNKYGLAKAIKLASMSMVMGVALLPFSASYAEEAIATDEAMAAEEAMASEESANVEEVFVTGSRIATSVSDTPRPVTVISAESLEAAGMENVADVLRNTSFNTMGSYREQSGSSFGGAALISLKGLGADRTAVLINGRRVPGNPFTGTSAVDLSTIPMSAVERVEILTDSASAVYGADAIGGVINIIMKKDFDGATFDISGGRTERGGGDTDNVKATFGSSTEKGSVLISVDWQKKDYIADSQRDYSGLAFLSDAPVPTDGVDLVGANGGGNTGLATDYSSAFSVGPCAEDYYITVLDPFGISGTGCGYIYSDISVMTMGVERFSTFLDARRKVGDNHELYIENRTSLSETFGRFAPAIGPFLIDAAAPVNTTGDDYILYHRFVAHGPRDDYARMTEFDTVVGINGSLFDNSVNYDFSARRYNYAAAEIGNNYILESVITDLVTAGEYDPTDPTAATNADAIAQSKATLSRDIGMESSGFQFTLDGMADFAGLNMGWAAGIEQVTEEYQDDYDSYRLAQNVIGSAGNSSSGSRKRWAAFAEVEMNLITDLDVNLAIRYDDYNDFGSNVSPQVSARYQVSDMLSLRASAGKGFKAPNLTAMYSELSVSSDQVADETRCQAQVDAGSLASMDDCPTPQVEVYSGGNPQLQAETSTSFNFGVIAEPIEDLAVSLDYYNVQIDDVVDQLDESAIFAAEQAGNLPTGVIVNRAPSIGGIPGNITNCAGATAPACGLINVYANLSELNVAGMDLRMEYTLDTSFGVFMPKLEWSHVTTYEKNGVDLLGTQEGQDAYPTDKANLSLGYVNGDLTVNYLYNWITEIDQAIAGGKFEAWDMHTINAVYKVSDELEFSMGIRNLTDEDPAIHTTRGWTSQTASTSMSLYDVNGRTYLASMKASF